MQRSRSANDLIDEQQYARVESLILDVQLSVASVRRANACLDLETVQRIRADACETLKRVDSQMGRVRPEPVQARRLAERRRTLVSLLREPAPIEQLARSLHVG